VDVLPIEGEEKIYRINIESGDANLLIGQKGDNLYALQLIAQMIIRQQLGPEYKLRVDIDDYKLKQQENALMMAKRKVDELRATGEDQYLPPMHPSLRKIVHLFIKKEHSDIITESLGNGNHRQVILKLNKA